MEEDAVPPPSPLSAYFSLLKAKAHALSERREEEGREIATTQAEVQRLAKINVRLQGLCLRLDENAQKERKERGERAQHEADEGEALRSKVGSLTSNMTARIKEAEEEEREVAAGKQALHDDLREWLRLHDELEAEIEAIKRETEDQVYSIRQHEEQKVVLGRLHESLSQALVAKGDALRSKLDLEGELRELEIEVHDAWKDVTRVGEEVTSGHKSRSKLLTEAAELRRKPDLLREKGKEEAFIKQLRERLAQLKEECRGLQALRQEHG
ncbi:unnamed protein product [Chrysoparadoxa australica]